MSYINDTVLNENRHLLYNLLDNYYCQGDDFWDNPLHTMLVSCTFSLIYIDMYKLRIPETNYTINSILDFISIPDLTINISCDDDFDCIYINFYYKNKFFACQRIFDLDTFEDIYRDCQPCSYNMLFKDSYPDAESIRKFNDLEIIAPTKYLEFDFNPDNIRNTLKYDISDTFIQIYGYEDGPFGKFYEYSEDDLLDDTFLPIPTNVDICDSSFEYIERLEKRS